MPAAGAATWVACPLGSFSAPGALACTPGCAPGAFPTRGACERCPATADPAWAQARPLLVFAGSLCLAGLLLLLAARCALARGGGARAAPWRDAAAAVGDLLLWLWPAAQGAAALCAQVHALAPPELAGFFGALAALQLKGVALPPACYASSPPFVGFWAAACFVGLGYAVAAAALAARRRALALAAAAALKLGYGAVVAVMAQTLTCTAEAPTSLAVYALSRSDGAALRQALGAAAPRLEDLKAAASSASSSASLNLTEALRVMIPVSVLVSEPFQVCREGAHLAAWWAAVALAVSHALGLPLLTLGALFFAGRRRGSRRALSAAAGGAAPPPGGEVASAPTPRGEDEEEEGEVEGGAGSPAPLAPTALAALLAALEDPALRSRAAWLPPVQQLLVAFFAGMVAFAARLGTAAEFAGAQAAVAVVALAAGALVWRVAPFKPRADWRRPIVALLYVLTAFAAALSGVLFDRRGAAVTIEQWEFSVVTVALAAGLLACLLFYWLQSLLWARWLDEFARKSRAGPLGAAGVAPAPASPPSAPPPPATQAEARPLQLLPSRRFASLARPAPSPPAAAEAATFILNPLRRFSPPTKRLIDTEPAAAPAAAPYSPTRRFHAAAAALPAAAEALAPAAAAADGAPPLPGEAAAAGAAASGAAVGAEAPPALQLRLQPVDVANGVASSSGGAVPPLKPPPEQPPPPGAPELPPLPDGWVVAASRKTGELFYWNRATKETRWTMEAFGAPP